MKNSKNNKPQSTEKVGYVVGILSLIPFVGFLLGVIAIVVGAVNKQKGPIILGICGIVVTVASFFGITILAVSTSHTGGGLSDDVHFFVTAYRINRDEKQLTLYFVGHGHYPSELRQANNPLLPYYGEDGWGQPFVYKTNSSGSDYTLTSPGKDGVLGTTDDIIYPDSTHQLSN